MKRFGQIASLALIIALFAAFNISVYALITYRCIDDANSEMKAKSVEVSEYLPFDEDSKIVRCDASLKLSDDLPVLDGAAAIFPVYSAFAGAVYPDDSCPYKDGDFTADSALQYHNTRGAYAAIVDGDADIIFCAAPSDEQLAYAKEKGVKLEMLPIGREAFVFLVNADNPVDDLTVEQVRGIYSGKYTNWKQVGGANKLIYPLQRNQGSGSQTTMLKFMGDLPMKKRPIGIIGGAIGYSFRYYVEGIVGKGGVKMLSLEGVYPDSESIRDGSYPVVGDIYAIYRAGSREGNIALLLDWILSDEGQDIIEKSGYVSLE